MKKPLEMLNILQKRLCATRLSYELAQLNSKITY